MMDDSVNFDVPNSSRVVDLRANARDCWPGGTLEYWHGESPPLPARVFWPRSTEEIERVFEFARNAGAPVVTYGADSGVCGGARAIQGAFVLDTKCLNTIGPLDEDRRTVEVDAGVNGQHLEDWLQGRGYTLGHSPSSIWCSTVGGWAAARGAGQFSSYYGVFEDMVLGMEAVSPGRGQFQVGLGTPGTDEDLAGLLGSEGTLAVITRLTLRVAPLPESRWLRGYHFRDVESAVDAMRGLMQGELWPSVLRLYDPVDTKIGGKTKPKSDSDNTSRFYMDWLKAIANLPALKRSTLALPLTYPSLINGLFDRLSEGCLLIVGFEGHPEQVKLQAAAAQAILAREGKDLGEEPGWRWFHSRHAVSFKLMPVFERGGFADTMEVACRWHQVEKLYDEVRAAVRGTAVVMAHMSHAYPEGCSIYFSFAGKGNKAVYERLWANALEAVLESGGTVTHHHGVGFLKAEAASREIGPAIACWKALKECHDPAGMLNPGRLFKEGASSLPGVTVSIEENDGLVWVQSDDTATARMSAAKDQDEELMWWWESLPPPPRWCRSRWQTGWTEVTGTIEGVAVRLGRGPRSAAGPDFRGWLAKESQGTMSLASVPKGERWAAKAKCPDPWVMARQILRLGFRPAVCTAEGQFVRVGFRGPACRAWGECVAQLTGLTFQEEEWTPAMLPSGTLQYCSGDDPDIVSVTGLGFLKPVDALSNE